MQRQNPEEKRIPTLGKRKNSASFSSPTPLVTTTLKDLIELPQQNLVGHHQMPFALLSQFHDTDAIFYLHHHNLRLNHHEDTIHSFQQKIQHLKMQGQTNVAVYMLDPSGLLTTSLVKTLISLFDKNQMNITSLGLEISDHYQLILSLIKNNTLERIVLSRRSLTQPYINTDFVNQIKEKGNSNGCILFYDNKLKENNAGNNSFNSLKQYFTCKLMDEIVTSEKKLSLRQYAQQCLHSKKLKVFHTNIDPYSNEEKASPPRKARAQSQQVVDKISQILIELAVTKQLYQQQVNQNIILTNQVQLLNLVQQQYEALLEKNKVQSAVLDITLAELESVKHQLSMQKPIVQAIEDAPKPIVSANEPEEEPLIPALRVDYAEFPSPPATPVMLSRPLFFTAPVNTGSFQLDADDLNLTPR